MDNLDAWFTLKAIPGIGNLLYRRLIERFGSPEAALSASAEQLKAVPGITRRQLRALGGRQLSAVAAGHRERLERGGIRVVTQLDPDYPALLLETPDPPPYLYVRGSLAGGELAVAVVGSRNATDYGRTVTRRLSADLADCGVLVVSGMARGIDTAAHEGALSAGGRTVAVLGSGLDRVYPPENRALARRIARCGAVISEQTPEASPDAHHFPARNRIISGMCLGTIVVEATLRSGSLITARLAADQNREVFAVPGSIQSFKSTGPHALIKQGAKLVEKAQDILDELPELAAGSAATLSPGSAPRPGQTTAPDLTDEEREVCRALGMGRETGQTAAVHLDDLARRGSFESGRLAGVLLKLELKGIVAQLAGQRYTLTLPG